MGRPLKIGESHEAIDRLSARMAELHIGQGEYAKALPWIQTGLAGFRWNWIREHWLTAMLLNHKAVIRWKQGDYEAAVPLFREALSMRRKTIGPEHPHTIQSLNNLGAVLNQCGDVDLAEPLLWEALEQFRIIRNANHPDIVDALLSLAVLKHAQGDYRAADSLCHEALETCRHVPVEEQVHLGRCLYQLGTTQMAQRRLQEAEGSFREALAVYGRLRSDSHPDVLQTRHDLARCLLSQGKPAEAEPVLSEAAQAFENTRLRVGSGYARATFQVSPYSALAATRLLLGMENEAWPAAERARGRALTDLLTRAGSRSLSAAERVVHDSLKGDLSRLESELAVLNATDHGWPAAERNVQIREVQKRLALAEANWCRFQRALIARHPITEGQVFSLGRIQNSLTDHTALIGWLYLDVDHALPATWGYVIRKHGPVRWIRLHFASDSMDGRLPGDQLHDFRHALAVASSWPFRPIAVDRIIGEAVRLRMQWLEPLMPHLSGVEHLVVIPSGPMLGVPIEALLDCEDQRRGEGYVVSYVPSATVYARLCENGQRREARATCRALLLGDPPFMSDHLSAMEAEECEGSDQPLLASAAPLLGTATLRSALAGHMETLARLPRLPWTRREVESLASVIPETTLLLGPKASEQELSTMAAAGVLRDYQIIHLATHALVDNASPEHSALVLARATLPDPCVAITAGDRIYDGLLSARDIVREWELDADLVTLSGCQTGLGREADGEGHIGLAHAFLQVGARSLLVSLWKVEEEATALLMARFYENLIGAYNDERNGRHGVPLSKAAALREAKRWLQAYARPDGTQPYGHPTYWSGFVLIGEP
jgi:CHAT domain-containing protein